MWKKIIIGPLNTNCYYYQSPSQRGGYLIDPGGEADRIIAFLEEHALKPEGIILTHGHLDHIAAAGEIQKHYSARESTIPLLGHPGDASWFGKDAERSHKKEFGSLGAQGSFIFNALFQGVPPLDTPLTGGVTIPRTTLIVIETPGHSLGSITLFSPKDGLAFTGDTLFQGGSGRTDLSGGSQEDMNRSLKMMGKKLPPETVILPGHGPTTTMGEELYWIFG